MSAEVASYSRYRRVAWTVIGASFVVFCLLCGAGAFGLYFVTAHSDLPNTATLERAHGTKLEIRRAGQKAWTVVSDHVTLHEGDSARTDRDTEGFITLFDQSTVQLYYDSMVTLARMRSSRFPNQFKDIQLQQETGSVKIATAALEPYAEMKFEVLVAGKSGVAKILESSVARVDVTDQPPGGAMAILALAGKSLVRAGGPWTEIPVGMMYRVTPGGASTPEPAEVELIGNGNFAPQQADPNQLTAGWRLSVTPGNTDDPPLARVITEELGGFTPYARLQRGKTDSPSSPSEPVEVRLRQDRDTAVNFYESLLLKAKVRIVSQSFIGPGQYPLTLRLTYDDVDGKESIWDRNFYIESSSFPQGGDQVEAGSWREFSWELTSQTPRPARLKAVELIVKGYSFNVSVTGLSLIAH
ncbi:MAG: hypothetical protein ACR2M0_12425 [Chloroflexia bacterium]